MDRPGFDPNIFDSDDDGTDFSDVGGHLQESDNLGGGLTAGGGVVEPEKD
jgi:hypothetical protein